MNVAYVSFSGGNNVLAWSGMEFRMGNALRNQGLDLEYIGKVDSIYRNISRMKKLAYMAAGREFHCVRDPMLIKALGRKISKRLARTGADVVFSVESILASHLDCAQPIAFWADATFGAMVDYYDTFTNLCPETIRTGNELERLALNRCRLAIYCSDWAAGSAIERYGADPAKVHVVPFGANLDEAPAPDQVRDMIEARPRSTCRLLFMGFEWRRKGGDRAVTLARLLNRKGLPTTLDIIGARPSVDPEDAPFVRLHGPLRKSDPEERDRLWDLMANAHFHVLFSRAECFAVGIADASAFGLPSLTSRAGGMPSAVKDSLNGITFAMDSQDGRADLADLAVLEDVADTVLRLFRDDSAYTALADSSYNESRTRLNWEVAGRQVKDLLLEHCQ